jgi:hypothetical protein
VKPVPHSHPGEVELCYDAFCARITTSEQVANALAGVIVGAVFLLGLAALAKALRA